MASIGEALNSEWDRLVNTTEARRALRRWRRLWPSLASCDDLRAVLDLRRDPTQAQAVLRPLALMAPTDDIAARTLLQALMPGLVGLARSAARDDTDGLSELVAIAWERIRTYPSHREGSVAGNVLLDVRKRYGKERGFGGDLSLTSAHAQQLTEPAAPPTVFETEMVTCLLRAALRSSQLCETELETIVRTRMYDVPLREIASERGISARSLGQQRWRAEERLRRMPEAAQVMSWSAA